MNKLIFMVLLSSTVVSSSFAALDKSTARTVTIGSSGEFEYTLIDGDGKNNCNKKDWKFGEKKVFVETWTLNKQKSTPNRCSNGWKRDDIVDYFVNEFSIRINDFSSAIDYSADETKEGLFVSRTMLGCIENTTNFSYSIYDSEGSKTFAPHKQIENTNYSGKLPVGTIEYIHYKIGSFQNSNVLEEDYRCSYTTTYELSY